MTDKEKLEEAKRLYKMANANERNMLESLFPELAESEDERIRKSIIEHLQSDIDDMSKSDCPFDFEAEIEELSKYIAWLEKQGDKPQGKTALEAFNEEKVDNANKIEPKFKVGDWITHNTANFIFKIINVGSNGYEVVNRENYKKTISFDNEDNYHLWTIQDAKEGDVLVYNNSSVEIILLFKRWMDGIGEGAYSYAHTFKNEILFNDWSDCGYTTHPATKEQRDQLEKAMKDAGYTFDFDEKELKKIEEEYNGEDYGIDGLWHAKNILEKTLGTVEGYQSDDGILSHKCAISAVKKLYEKKSAKWSEEDEHRLKDTIYFLDTAKKHYASIVELDACIDWLKSLEELAKKYFKQSDV